MRYLLRWIDSLEGGVEPPHSKALRAIESPKALAGALDA